MSTLKGKRIGFIGGGQMAEAIFSGIIKSGKVLPKDILVTDINAQRLVEITEKYKLSSVPNNSENEGIKEVIESADIIFFAVKPQYFKPLIPSIQASLNKKRHIILSIVGGGTLKMLEHNFKVPVIRIMPNIPMTVGKGIAIVLPGTGAAKEHIDIAEEIFSLVGKTYIIPEALFEPMNSITGCGIAYVAMFIEAMADGGVKMGVPRDMAYELAALTLSGTAEMVMQGMHPAVIKDKVCSPGGGTIVGVKALEDGAFRSTVMNAVEGGMTRMLEISKAMEDSEKK